MPGKQSCFPSLCQPPGAWHSRCRNLYPQTAHPTAACASGLGPSASAAATCTTGSGVRDAMGWVGAKGAIHWLPLRQDHDACWRRANTTIGTLAPGAASPHPCAARRAHWPLRGGCAHGDWSRGSRHRRAGGLRALGTPHAHQAAHASLQAACRARCTSCTVRPATAPRLAAHPPFAVEAVGKEVAGLQPGDRVALEPGVPCCAHHQFRRELQSLR